MGKTHRERGRTRGQPGHRDGHRRIALPRACGIRGRDTPAIDGGDDPAGAVDEGRGAHIGIDVETTQDAEDGLRVRAGERIGQARDHGDGQDPVLGREHGLDRAPAEPLRRAHGNAGHRQDQRASDRQQTGPHKALIGMEHGMPDGMRIDATR